MMDRDPKFCRKGTFPPGFCRRGPRLAGFYSVPRADFSKEAAILSTTRVLIQSHGLCLAQEPES
jgi:hypothetical protein